MATKPYTYTPSNTNAVWPPGISGYYLADPRQNVIPYEDIDNPYKYTLDFNIKHGLREGNPGFRYAKVEDAHAALKAGHWSYQNQADLSTFYQARDDVKAVQETLSDLRSDEESRGRGQDEAARQARAAQPGSSSSSTAGVPFGGLDKSKDPRDYENPPFDPRILRIWNPEGGRFYRGYMQQSKEYTNPTGRLFPRRLNFLYNPSSITVGYQGSIIGFDPATSARAGDTGNMLIPNMQKTEFSLFFDRTYEVAGLRHPHKKMASWRGRLTHGVRADIMALEEMVGIREGQGPILRIPIDLCFGLPEYSDDPAQEAIYHGPVGPTTYMRRPIKQYGWVSSMTVEYQHFANNMTPTRARVQIEFMHQIKGKGENSNVSEVDPNAAPAGAEIVQ